MRDMSPYCVALEVAERFSLISNTLAGKQHLGSRKLRHSTTTASTLLVTILKAYGHQLKRCSISGSPNWVMSADDQLELASTESNGKKCAVIGITTVASIHRQFSYLFHVPPVCGGAAKRCTQTRSASMPSLREIKQPTARERKLRGSRLWQKRWRDSNILQSLPTKYLCLILSAVKNIIVDPPPRQKPGFGGLSSLDTWRWCFCQTCWGLVLACNVNLKHKCVDGSDEQRVNDKEFPTLRRIIYAHNILGVPDLVPLVPKFLDIVTPVAVNQVFTFSENQALAHSLFPDLDFSNLGGTIWVDKDCTDSIEHSNLCHDLMQSYRSNTYLRAQHNKCIQMR
ncbi:hypothetical protein B0H19DRAFT_1056252 [Mycena capillaripes]|nr:hypothetical protein B0H19DRAFT_1056252 [Mycena capillaripes]